MLRAAHKELSRDIGPLIKIAEQARRFAKTAREHYCLRGQTIPPHFTQSMWAGPVLEAVAALEEALQAVRGRRTHYIWPGDAACALRWLEPVHQNILEVLGLTCLHDHPNVTLRFPGGMAGIRTHLPDEPRPFPLIDSAAPVINVDSSWPTLEAALVDAVAEAANRISRCLKQRGEPTGGDSLPPLNKS